jgi:polar amino acid transport system substrate-binding protein
MPQFSRRRLGALALLFAFLSPAGEAEAQTACSNYTVARGDTLSKIATAAGLASYQVLYSANRSVLASPNLIEVGQVLSIPCADGALPVPEEKAAAVVEPEPVAVSAKPPARETSAAPAAGDAAVRPTIRFLTAGNYAPFTDEDAPEQGLFTELVKVAMEKGAGGRPYRIDFVNDWGSHLTTLLPTGAFDLGFPWYLPDCSKVDLLAPETAMRCTDYDASDPFFDTVLGFYTARGSDLAGVEDPAKLAGARLCRPDGWFVFDLETAGLMPPATTLVRPETQMGCWDALLAGEVDVVTFEVLAAEDDIKQRGIAGQVEEIDGLANVATLHVFAHKSNPFGRVYLTFLNKGLREMRNSGEWFMIVSRQLRHHQQKLASEN